MKLSGRLSPNVPENAAASYSITGEDETPCGNAGLLKGSIPYFLILLACCVTWSSHALIHTTLSTLSTLKMEAANSYETSLITYQYTSYHIPEWSILCSYYLLVLPSCYVCLQILVAARKHISK